MRRNDAAPPGRVRNLCLRCVNNEQNGAGGEDSLTDTAHQGTSPAASGKPGNAAQGEVFFNSTHGDKWSCATCHGKPATATGKHASTGKAIKPMAPAVNPEVFTDTANIDKWFRRNCKDVISRECSSTEKADVIAYLLSLSR